MNRFLLAIALSIGLSASAMAQDIVDVFFVIGQSNAGNFGELNSYDSQGYPGGKVNHNKKTANRAEAGFTLSASRIFDRDSVNKKTGVVRPRTSVNEVYESFSESSLDPEQFATDRLGVNLNKITGNDIAIFNFSRNGRPLANLENDRGQSWYPGADPAGGEVYDDELYKAFQNYGNARIEELKTAGKTVNVKGFFWFQGEGDASARKDGEYQENFENLVERLRIDFGEGLPVIAAKILEVKPPAAARRNVNGALNAVAENDPMVSVVETSDLGGRGDNVHLSAEGFAALADRFSASFQAISEPE